MVMCLGSRLILREPEERLEFTVGLVRYRQE
jgi:hypothetical protein